MIIFYDKKTGNIVGTIDGRIHSDTQKKMWIGNQKEVSRKIIEFKPINEREEIIEEDAVVGYGIDDEGFETPIFKKIKRKNKVCDFEPDCNNTTQKNILIDIDRKRKHIKNFKIDLKTLDLIDK
jgi:hypothetical protein